MNAAVSSSPPSKGFTLVEVVIALGIAATGLVVVLALIPSLIKQQAETEASYVAAGLVQAATSELRRIAGNDVAALSTRAADFAAVTSPLRLVADRTGADVREFVGFDGRGQFFLIELYRYPDDSLLRMQTGRRFAALQARVSWPFRPQGTDAGEVATESRERVSFGVLVQP